MKTWSSVSILEYAVESVNEGLIDIATYKDVSLSPNQWRALADMTWKKNVVSKSIQIVRIIRLINEVFPFFERKTISSEFVSLGH